MPPTREFLPLTRFISNYSAPRRYSYSFEAGVVRFVALNALGTHVYFIGIGKNFNQVLCILYRLEQLNMRAFGIRFR